MVNLRYPNWGYPINNCQHFCDCTINNNSNLQNNSIQIICGRHFRITHTSPMALSSPLTYAHMHFQTQSLNISLDFLSFFTGFIPVGGFAFWAYSGFYSFSSWHPDVSTTFAFPYFNRYSGAHKWIYYVACSLSFRYITNRYS